MRLKRLSPVCAIYHLKLSLRHGACQSGILSSTNAPDFTSSESGDFFASLKLKVDKTSADIRKEYEVVMKHLLKIEQVVFDSATGKIEELRTYYEYWENEVYEALVRSTERMILHVKECFEDSSRVDFTLFWDRHLFTSRRDRVRTAAEGDHAVCHAPHSDLVAPPSWVDGWTERASRLRRKRQSTRVR